MDYNTVREQCEICLSFNYIDANAENVGYEAFECWNCKNHQFLPDEDLFRFMDRENLEEYEAIGLLQTNNVLLTDGRSIP